jgi:imidazole glycerol phosphate synthase subunit HisF
MHRLIARLDIKGENLIKSVQLDGVRVVGDPRVQAQLYYEQGIDELVFMDAVASLYNRNQLSEVVSYTCENVFIPLTVGGGLRSLADVGGGAAGRSRQGGHQHGGGSQAGAHNRSGPDLRLPVYGSAD